VKPGVAHPKEQQARQPSPREITADHRKATARRRRRSNIELTQFVEGIALAPPVNVPSV